MAEIVVVHGYAGAGKSTHCSKLEQEGFMTSSVQHISAGNRLRGIRTGLEHSMYEQIINAPDAPSPLPDEVVSSALLESIEQSGDKNLLVLIDGYPRHPLAVEPFRDELVRRSHLLLGTLALQVSLETSVARILHRGERSGEKIKADTLEEFAIQRYELDKKTTNVAIEALSHLAPVEIIDSGYRKELVYANFKKAISSLIGSK